MKDVIPHIIIIYDIKKKKNYVKTRRQGLNTREAHAKIK